MSAPEEKLVVSKRRKWYTPSEIALHNCAADCWVSVFGKVYDLTSLLEKSKGPLCQPIIKFAGEDVSSWFDEATRDVKTQWDPENSLVCPFLPLPDAPRRPPHRTTFLVHRRLNCLPAR